jgi:hypothetical protein
MCLANAAIGEKSQCNRKQKAADVASFPMKHDLELMMYIGGKILWSPTLVRIVLISILLVSFLLKFVIL